MTPDTRKRVISAIRQQIKQAGSCSQADLARALGVTPMSASRYARELEAEGYLVRGHRSLTLTKKATKE